MKMILLVGSLALATTAFAGSAQMPGQQGDQSGQQDQGQDAGFDSGDAAAPMATPAVAGTCNFQAVAFSNRNFRQQQNAQNQCNNLVQQTGGNAADCQVVKLNNGRFQARFRKVLNLQNVNIGTLIQDFGNFLTQFNIFGSNQIKVQSAASNGCG